MPPWPPSRDAAASPAYPYEIEFARKELLEQATRRLSLDRRSPPTDTDVDILIPRPGASLGCPLYCNGRGSGLSRSVASLGGQVC